MGQITTVTIGGVVYSIYGELAADAGTTQISADEYFNADIQWSATWTGLSADSKARSLVSATRALDTFSWAGSKTSSSQPLQWPRTGVTYRDGTAVDSATLPDELVTATYILAVMLSQDPSLMSTSTATKANVAEVGAGTARVKFHRPLSVSVLPLEIVGLIAQFLGGNASGFGAASVTGASDESSFDTDDLYSVGMP
jgi:hypothetical protein